MSKTGWKRAERAAARLIGGQRYPANTGGLVDVESDGFVAQVKEIGRLSLAELEKLAMEMERIGFQKAKTGLVLVKRSAGRGLKTPWLVVLSEGAWRDFMGQP